MSGPVLLQARWIFPEFCYGKPRCHAGLAAPGAFASARFVHQPAHDGIAGRQKHEGERQTG